jgi:hypothetical protein
MINNLPFKELRNKSLPGIIGWRHRSSLPTQSRNISIWRRYTIKKLTTAETSRSRKNGILSSINKSRNSKQLTKLRRPLLPISNDIIIYIYIIIICPMNKI